MPDCELLSTCPFFNDNMYEMAETYKEWYCKGDYAWCGKYMAFKALEREKFLQTCCENQSEVAMRVGTKVFEFYQEKYTNLSELARAMGISQSQIYRVRRGERHINEKFIIGVVQAFPGYRLDDLFYLDRDGSQNDDR